MLVIIYFHIDTNTYRTYSLEIETKYTYINSGRNKNPTAILTSIKMVVMNPSFTIGILLQIFKIKLQCIVFCC